MPSPSVLVPLFSFATYFGLRNVRYSPIFSFPISWAGGNPFFSGLFLSTVRTILLVFIRVSTDDHFYPSSKNSPRWLYAITRHPL